MLRKNEATIGRRGYRGEMNARMKSGARLVAILSMSVSFGSIGILGTGCGGADQAMPSTLPPAPAAPAAPVVVVPAGAPVPPAQAVAKLESRSGSTVTGTVTVDQTPGGVSIVIQVSGAKPGKHGVHLHETGDCSAPDAKSAGGHFNPTGTTHLARPPCAPHHGGDLGNLDVGADGNGKLTIVVPDLTTFPGTTSVIGRSVVVHDGEDDLHSQPAGNSGSRVACGVILAK